MFVSAEERYAMHHAVWRDPELNTPQWVRERALRGLVALVESDPDVLREVLETLTQYAGR